MPFLHSELLWLAVPVYLLHNKQSVASRSQPSRFNVQWMPCHQVTHSLVDVHMLLEAPNPLSLSIERICLVEITEFIGGE